MRVTTDLWVSALLRRVFGAGGFAAVVNRGATEAGAVFVLTRGRLGDVALSGRRRRRATIGQARRPFLQPARRRRRCRPCSMPGWRGRRNSIPTSGWSRSRPAPFPSRSLFPSRRLEAGAAAIVAVRAPCGCRCLPGDASRTILTGSRLSSRAPCPVPRRDAAGGSGREDADGLRMREQARDRRRP